MACRSSANVLPFERWSRDRGCATVNSNWDPLYRRALLFIRSILLLELGPSGDAARLSNLVGAWYWRDRSTALSSFGLRSRGLCCVEVNLV